MSNVLLNWTLPELVMARVPNEDSEPTAPVKVIWPVPALTARSFPPPSRVFAKVIVPFPAVVTVGLAAVTTTGLSPKEMLASVPAVTLAPRYRGFAAVAVAHGHAPGAA